MFFKNKQFGGEVPTFKGGDTYTIRYSGTVIQ